VDLAPVGQNRLLLVVLAEPEVHSRPTLIHMRIKRDWFSHTDVGAKPELTDIPGIFHREALIQEVLRFIMEAVKLDSATGFQMQRHGMLVEARIACCNR